tara:strand:- start:10 stop:720 length:711 start_codon:yes stop_codon:yes gene_type:complete
MQSEYNSEYCGNQELIDIEVMKNYNYSIVKNAFRKIDNNTSEIIDFGAGIGTLSSIFRDEFGLRPLCIEIDKENNNVLKDRQFSCFRDLKSVSHNVDFIFSSNVLEHIKDDSSALISMRDHLKIGGRLYLYLPARMCLWTSLDESVGHYRRYEINSLRNKCNLLGFKVSEIYFADCLGFFATLFWKFINKNSKRNFASRKSLIFYDKYIFPISSFLDRLGFKFLFGKNIVLVAEKI